MLLIIADYPNEMNMREGAMQRIDAIDSLIRDRKRVYLNISFKKHLVRSNSSFNNVIVENLNAIIHRNIIKQYMQK
ncbi:TPA: glycosyl transferase family 2, partial [Escherichia coli]